MDLSSVLDEKKIDLNLDVKTKEEALRALGDMLWKAGVLSSKEAFIKDVYCREAEGATGIGGGIAIPHGKSGSVLKTSLAMARTKHPIQWETLDDEPVRFIILFAVRDIDKTTVHMKLLSEVAAKLADDDVAGQLLTSSEPADIVAIFN